MKGINDIKNLVILNGSPRGEVGATGAVIKDMESFLPDSRKTTKLELKADGLDMSLNDLEQKILYAADEILVVFPLYVDMFPSNLLYCLKDMESNKGKFAKGKEVKVYAFVNCGLYEGFQSFLAMDMLKNWTLRMGFKFGMAVGFGGSGAIPGAKKIKPGEGLKKDMPRLFHALFDSIGKGKIEQENLYGGITITREEYQSSSENGWRKLAKRNGLAEKDLDKRW